MKRSEFEIGRRKFVGASILAGLAAILWPFKSKAASLATSIDVTVDKGFGGEFSAWIDGKPVPTSCRIEGEKYVVTIEKTVEGGKWIHVAIARNKDAVVPKVEGSGADDIRHFNRVLTTEERQRIYNEGS